jgi:hypothetical protein
MAGITPAAAAAAAAATLEHVKGEYRKWLFQKRLLCSNAH